jgi:hypothetical protein
MPWISPESAVDDVEEKISEIREKIDQRRKNSSLTYEYKEIAQAVGDSLAAGTALRREWFYSSVGIDWDGEEAESFYVVKAPIAGSFATDYVVPWTHWIGRVCTQIRHYIEENGGFPSSLVYGPKGRQSPRKVGPLIRYQFKDGVLVDCEYTDTLGARSLFAELAATASDDVTITETEPPIFGLKDIIELRDLDQDDQIRGPMAGIFILTGGPGVGKTSVALHRIPYLILEQGSQLPAEVPGVRSEFFRAETIHVVVWKEHLVPYLKQCLGDLGFGDIAVQHVEEWVARCLRDYVRMGNGRSQYRVDSRDEPEEFLGMKLGFTGANGGEWRGLTEHILSGYLTGKDSNGFHNGVANDLLEMFRDHAAEVRELFEGVPLPLLIPDPTAAFVPTVAGIESAISLARDGLDRLAEEVNLAIEALGPSSPEKRLQLPGYERIRRAIPRAREKVSTLRDRVIGHLTRDYATMLSEFYKSAMVNAVLRERFGQDRTDRFIEHACGRLDGYRMTRCDRYLLLWLVNTITKGAAGMGQARPLPIYSHTVIDEAQYYDPIILRLLVDLAEAPLKSVTIVGDLEQKINQSGGLLDWKDVGISVSDQMVYRLKTNYRWSKAVFGFLDRYRRLVGVGELRAPRRWTSGEGLAPTIVHCLSEDDQFTWLIGRISDLRLTNGSIAVVVPPGMETDWRERLIADLKSCDIKAKWATGDNVREYEEQVILTDYESIVGLEFDMVLLPGCEQVLSPPEPAVNAIQAAWVALTRARKYLGISHVGPIAIFSEVAFKDFRSDYEPEDDL